MKVIIQPWVHNNGQFFGNKKNREKFKEDFNFYQALEDAYNKLKISIEETKKYDPKASSTNCYDIEFKELFDLIDIDTYQCIGDRLEDEFRKLKMNLEFAKNLQKLDCFDGNCFEINTSIDKAIVWLLNECVFIVTRKHYRKTSELFIDVEVAHCDLYYEASYAIIDGKLRAE